MWQYVAAFLWCIAKVVMLKNKFPGNSFKLCFQYGVSFMWSITQYIPVVRVRILPMYSLHFVKGREGGTGKPLHCTSTHSRKRCTQEWDGKILLPKPNVYTFS